MNLFSIAFALFLLMDPIGNIPFYISFLQDLEPKRQRQIIFRELIIALVIIILFSFLGDALMNSLKIKPDAIQIAGGIILFILCLKMIFPSPHDPNEALHNHTSEPFIVPLAVPLIAGPGVLAAVMIYARQESNALITITAIIIAWVASLIILLASSFLKKMLSWRGIIAMERLMGLILILMAVQMFLNGIGSFISRFTS